LNPYNNGEHVCSPLRFLLKGISAGDFSSQEVIDHYKSRIEKFNQKLGAFLFLNPSDSFEDGSLKGIPIGLKDNLVTKDMPTTCASKILKGYIPPYDAHVVSRLRSSGAWFPGKLNMDEFAMGSSNEYSAFSPVRNPWNLDCVPGGSSGGSAASVAAGLVPAALGSDTGGSIRQPASFCGVTGLKPTYGRVSRYGLIAFASSLDQIGTFTRTAEDAALLLSIISGHDQKDSTSANVDLPDFSAQLTGNIKGLKIGLPKEYFSTGLSDEVESAVKKAVTDLEKEGAVVEEVSLPHSKYAVAVYYLVATAEASSNLARFDGMRYGLRVEDGALIPTYEKTRGTGFGAEVKRRIMLGTYALSAGYYDAFYKKALQVRTLIQRDFISAFEKFDIIAAPTTPTTAFKLGENLSDPLTMYLQDIYTISANLAGLPAISIPCGFSKENLPIGLQMIGKPFAESEILKAADAYQRITDWHLRRPREFDE